MSCIVCLARVFRGALVCGPNFPFIRKTFCRWGTCVWADFLFNSKEGANFPFVSVNIKLGVCLERVFTRLGDNTKEKVKRGQALCFCRSDGLVLTLPLPLLCFSLHTAARPACPGHRGHPSNLSPAGQQEDQEQEGGGQAQRGSHQRLDQFRGLAQEEQAGDQATGLVWPLVLLPCNLTFSSLFLFLVER